MRINIFQILNTHLEITRQQILRALLYTPIVPCIAFIIYFIFASLFMYISEQNSLSGLDQGITSSDSVEVIVLVIVILLFITVFYYFAVIIFAYFLQILFSKIKRVNFYTISISACLLAIPLISLLEFSFPPSLKGLALVTSIGWIYSSTFWFFAYRQHLKNIKDILP